MTQTARARLEGAWLDALDLIEHAAPLVDTRHIFLHTVLEPFADLTHKAHFFKYESAGPRVTHYVNAELIDLPRIELIEICCAMALESWKVLEDIPWKGFHTACSRIGCDYSNSPHPRERWRWIMSLHGADKFLIWKYEDRPSCGYCGYAMPTGSDCHPSRAGVHEGCGYKLDEIAKAARELLAGVAQ